MCPHCGEPLVGFELEGIEIDRCVACGGTWLDTGELESIAELAGVAAGPFRRALDAARGGSRGQGRCPRCRRRLRVALVGDASREIELDRCPAGHGLWLDRGEMAGVIRLFHEGEEGAVARFFREMYRSEIESGS